MGKSVANNKHLQGLPDVCGPGLDATNSQFASTKHICNKLLEKKSIKENKTEEGSKKPKLSVRK